MASLGKTSGKLPLLLSALLLAMLVASFSRPALAGVEQWTSHGPEGGDVTEIVVDPTSPNFVYAALNFFGGVFRSADSGVTWQRTNFPAGEPISALVIDPKSPATLYVAGGSAVFKTVDRGQSWTSTPVSPSAAVSSLAIDPVTPSTLYAGLNGGPGKVFKSTDSGASWQPGPAAFGTPSSIQKLAIDPATPSTLYADVYPAGLFKSTNGGQTWAALPNGPKTIAASQRALVVDPGLHGTLYAIDILNGTFKSTDGGATWTHLNVDGDVDETALVIAPTSSATLYVATSRNGIVKSGDGGATWERAGLGNEQVFELAIDPTHPSTLYAGTFGYGGGVFKSTDAARAWTATHQGFVGTVISTLTIDPSDRSTVYAVTDSGDGFRTTDGGLSWSTFNLPGSQLVTFAVDPITPTTIYAINNFGVVKSLDDGQHWALASNGLPQVPFGLELAIDPVTPSTLYLGTLEAGVWKSLNGGETWRQTGIGNVPVLALAIDPRSPSTLYAATGGHDILKKSTDGGRTWVTKDVGPSSTIYAVSAIAIDPNDSSRVYACDTADSFFRSTDAGDHWVTGDISCQFLAIPATSPAVVYAAGPNGVSQSRDGGVSWSAIGNGLPGSQITALVVDAGGSTLHAGTLGQGVFAFTTSPPTPCAAGDTTLCLHGGRFAVSASYATAAGQAGAGHAVSLTDDSAYFWFFSPSNVEVFLKVVDGCALNGHFWIFGSGLTDVQTRLVVTDSVTGVLRTYVNPQNTAFEPVEDTGALPCSSGLQ